MSLDGIAAAGGVAAHIFLMHLPALRNLVSLERLTSAKSISVVDTGVMSLLGLGRLKTIGLLNIDSNEALQSATG